MSERFEVVRKEASYWWRTNSVTGLLLNRSMLLFIVIPIVLVIRNQTGWSVAVFAGMIPYGLLLEYLAQRAVHRFIAGHPESLEEFRKMGVIRTPDP